ncbi:MAG: response regulator [Gammaproteobacteria bacterium]|jgi:two-component system KDP operon response regulator KdpE|uniref:response regulator n=1 Tax=Nevskia sp. TaxID=1929292 RepID=UPI0040370EA4|nr:response regulator [Gammaproteobacteria bacterium]
MSLELGKVLVVDDEAAIRRLLRNTLQVNDYRVFEAGTVAEALALSASHQPDVILLDLGLPDGDGLSVIEAVRQRSAVPIIVLSSRTDDSGKVRALDAGADDYVTKPFSVDELLARIRTALRHRMQRQGAQPLFVRGGLSVDLVRRLVLRDGVEVRLSPKEYGILQQLVLHAGRVLTHRHLLREVWQQDSDGDVAYLRVYIRQLRGKLEVNPEQPSLIVTEPGVGYRLRSEA